MLWSAISLKSLESIELLLRHGGPIDHTDPDITSALASAPVTAILHAQMKDGATVHVDLESNVLAYVYGGRSDFQELNPMYVRLELGPDDQGLLRGLVPRRPADELRDGIRELDLWDSLMRSDSGLDKTTMEKLADWQTDQGRVDELDEDEDVLPKWKPLFVPG